MAESKSDQALDIVKLGVYVVGGYFGLKAIKKIAEGLGLSDSKEEEENKEAFDQSNQDSTTIQNQNNPFVAFNPNYAPAIVIAWKKKYPGLVWNAPRQEHFSRDQYKAWALEVYNARMGWAGDDDEDILYHVFRSLQTQWQLSLFSSVFNYYYKTDLLLFLKGFLSANELNDILQIVKYYPQYYK